jgi:hypothetical protein
MILAPSPALVQKRDLSLLVVARYYMSLRLAALEFTSDKAIVTVQKIAKLERTSLGQFALSSPCEYGHVDHLIETTTAIGDSRCHHDPVISPQCHSRFALENISIDKEYDAVIIVVVFVGTLKIALTLRKEIVPLFDDFGITSLFQPLGNFFIAPRSAVVSRRLVINEPVLGVAYACQRDSVNRGNRVATNQSCLRSLVIRPLSSYPPLLGT